MALASPNRYDPGMSGKIDKCGTCGARIRWAKKDGKNHPFNYSRVRVYNLEQVGVGQKLSHLVRVPNETDPGHGLEAALYYISHFTTCPHASQHSSRKDTARVGGRHQEDRHAPR